MHQGNVSTFWKVNGNGHPCPSARELRPLKDMARTLHSDTEDYLRLLASPNSSWPSFRSSSPAEPPSQTITLALWFLSPHLLHSKSYRLQFQNTSRMKLTISTFLLFLSTSRPGSGPDWALIQSSYPCCISACTSRFLRAIPTTLNTVPWKRCTPTPLPVFFLLSSEHCVSYLAYCQAPCTAELACKGWAHSPSCSPLYFQLLKQCLAAAQ